METQALPTLRPLRLGELLDQALRLYRRNFITFIGIIALVHVPLTLLQAAISALTSSTLLQSDSLDEIFSNTGLWAGIGSGLILFIVQFILVQGIATGALTRAVADIYLGRQSGILNAYKSIGRAWLSLLGALLFILLLYLLMVIWWLIVPCLGWFTGLGMMVFLLAAIHPLVPPIVVLEKQSAIASVRRAWSLARYRFWPLLGYAFVLYLFSLIIVIGPSMVANAALGITIPFVNSAMDVAVTTLIQSLVQLITSLIYYPVQMTAFTLIYFDLRVRTEGFDLALQTLDAPTADLAQIVTPPPPANERLITGQDLGNFAILTFVSIGIFILYYIVILAGAVFIMMLFS
ncbi:MAG TPA: hypothetical protein VNK49_11150 [Anaerolineales bacterium]|nr:hypothetical protein [Anaerolineales bacterium]